MPPLTAVERFFERLFERPSARLFRARLQPIQIQHRIERAMEGERLTTTDRTLVPNRFVVHLHPADMTEFGDMTGTLASELADGALAGAPSTGTPVQVVTLVLSRVSRRRGPSVPDGRSLSG